jgi:excisionase family DNA binding protein
MTDLAPLRFWLEALIRPIIREVLRDELHDNLPITAPPTPEKPLNIDEAAKMLELSKTTIYGLVHHQLIPNYKTGKRLYFDRAELMEWVRSGRRKTIKEAQAEAAAHKKGGVSK